jgi:hypothetical protein
MALVFFYHTLNFLLIGPLAYFVVSIFSGRQYASNLAFGCSRAMMTFNVIQNMTYICTVIPVALILY